MPEGESSDSARVVRVLSEYVLAKRERVSGVPGDSPLVIASRATPTSPEALERALRRHPSAFTRNPSKDSPETL